MAAAHKKKKGSALVLVVALVLYAITAVIAVYIGTIAIMPQGAILTVALFALATYGLRVFFRKRGKSEDQDADLSQK